MEQETSALNSAFLTAWMLRDFPLSTYEIRKIVPLENSDSPAIQAAWNAVLTETERARLTSYLLAALNGATQGLAAKSAHCGFQTIERVIKHARRNLNTYVTHVKQRVPGAAFPPSLGNDAPLACNLSVEEAWLPTLSLLPDLPAGFCRGAITKNYPYIGQLLTRTHERLLSEAKLTYTALDSLEQLLAKRGWRLALAGDPTRWWSDLEPTRRLTCFEHCRRIKRHPGQFWQGALPEAAKRLGTTREHLLDLIADVTGRGDESRGAYPDYLYASQTLLGLTRGEAVLLENLLKH